MGGGAGVVPVGTNIVLFHLAAGAPEAGRRVARLAERGTGAFGPLRMRIVTHVEVNATAVDTLCHALQPALSQARQLSCGPS